jgi:non-specific serine/threonine protein kinase
LTDENAPAVVEICRRLDGLPLAIELAAARVKLLPPHGLLARLDHRLTLLTGGPRDLPERHQTLRATLRWSYDLLTGPEQRLFRGLAVFPAGCTLDAAEAVLGPLVGIEVLDGIASLLDKSLLVRAEQPDGTPRYQMLETVREFAAEHLASSGEADELHHRLVDWGLTLYDPNLSTTFSARHYSVFARLTAELDNLRAAVLWGCTHYPPARQLAGYLAWYYTIRGLLRDATLLVDQVLEAAHDDPPHVRTALLWAASSSAYGRRDFTLALEYAARGEAVATEAMMPGYGDFLVIRGLVASFTGDFTAAEALLTQALTQLDRPERGAASANHARAFLAMTFYRAGLVERAAVAADEALALARECGDDWCAAIALFTLARIARDRGDAASALAAFVESAKLSWSVGDVRQVAGCLWRTAALLAHHQHKGLAVRLLAVATTLQEVSGTLAAPGGPTSARKALAELQAQLPAESFEAALRDGRAMTPDQAIELAATIDLSAGHSLTPVAVPTPFGLTPRELEILRLLVEDRSSQQMADELSISQRTVTTHITNIFNKLGVNSRAAAVAQALRQGLA